MERLAELRQHAGLTQDRVAQLLDVTKRSYVRYEAGARIPFGRRAALAEILGVPRRRLDAALGDAPDAPDALAVPVSLTIYMSLEQGASSLWAFQAWTVHALLQTAAYAEAVERSAPRQVSDEAVTRRVELRMARQQQVLFRDRDPLRLSVVLDEGVLLRTTGGLDVMAEQCDHLAEMAELPNIDLRVLPLGAGIHPASEGGFALVASASVDRAQVVCVSDGTGVRYLEGAATIHTYGEVFDHLCQHSLTSTDSVDVIRRTQKERYTS
jgi:transcriptional regulator with XRE-family HTH domain